MPISVEPGEIGVKVRDANNPKGFMSNNSGLLIGGGVALLAIFGTDGGIMSWLMAAVAILGGLANDGKEGIFGGGSLFGEKKHTMGLGKAKDLSAETPGKAQDQTTGPSAEAKAAEAKAAEAKAAEALAASKISIPRNSEINFMVDADGKKTKRRKEEIKEGDLFVVVERGANDIESVKFALAGKDNKFPDQDTSKGPVLLNAPAGFTFPVIDDMIDLNSPATQKQISTLRALASQAITNPVAAVAPFTPSPPQPAATPLTPQIPLANAPQPPKTITQPPADAVSKPATPPSIPAPKGKADSVIFMLDAQGNITDVEKKGVVRIGAYSNGKVGEVSILHLAATNESGNFPSEKNGEQQWQVIKTHVNMSMPVKDGKIDLDSDKAKAILMIIRSDAQQALSSTSASQAPIKVSDGVGGNLPSPALIAPPANNNQLSK